MKKPVLFGILFMVSGHSSWHENLAHFHWWILRVKLAICKRLLSRSVNNIWRIYKSCLSTEPRLEFCLWFRDTAGDMKTKLISLMDSEG